MYDIELSEEFKIEYVSVKLNDASNYHTTFKVNGVTLFMRVNYNTRNKERSIILETLNSEVVLSQTFVTYGRRCELNFNGFNNSLDYYITLKPIDQTKIFDDSYDYINWSKDFELCFVGWDSSYTNRADSNVRVYLTGN